MNVQTFDVYRTEDGTVSKYIHEDGSETAIKLVKSVQSVFNPLTNKIDVNHTDRNKYSIFISSSVGCYMKCKFCHLTLKKAKHTKINHAPLLANLKEALEDVVAFNPDIKNRYVKLSWMGMGDAINKPDMVYEVTLKLLDWIFEKGYAIGLDGVDLSTVMPKLSDDLWIETFHLLDDKLKKYKINPIYTMDNVQATTGSYSHKNRFRLFFSVGSADQDKRHSVIPNAMQLRYAIPLLKKYSNDSEFTLIFHNLFVDGLNDSIYDVLALIKFIEIHFPENELRILRYNSCAKNGLKESEQFVKYVRLLSGCLKFIKVQVSPGKEVSAACGQFIVKDFTNHGKNIEPVI